MHLGIDATNIRIGGGITHLVKLLQNVDPIAFGFSHVTVWTSESTAKLLPEQSWLSKRSSPWMSKPSMFQLLWQQFKLPRELSKAGCDVLFSPGGTLPLRCRFPSVTMSQNLLPFEVAEAALFGRFSFMYAKMQILRLMQSKSFQVSSGVIFLTQYAHSVVVKTLGRISCRTILIPHGIEMRFLQSPRPQRLLSECTVDNPFRLLYVSIFMPYKHQIEVALAVRQLRMEGIPIQIKFIGDSWGGYGIKFLELLDRLDPGQEFLHWSGPESFDVLHSFYQDADAFIFGSSCENLPNILIESMAAGLPIASSDCGPMPEVLGNAGIYFDPRDPLSIANALRKLLVDMPLRARLAKLAWIKANTYSWKRCASDTFEFIANVARHKSL